MKRLLFPFLFSLFFASLMFGQGTVVVIADPTGSPHTVTWRLPPGALASNIVVADYTPVASGFAITGNAVSLLYGTNPTGVNAWFDPVYYNAYMTVFDNSTPNHLPMPLDLSSGCLADSGSTIHCGQMQSEGGFVSNVTNNSTSPATVGSWQGFNSNTDGILVRGYHVAPTPDGLGGYVALAPVPYAPYGSNGGTAGTVCFDVYGNVVTQPTPLRGLSPTLWTSSATSTVVEWNGPSAMQGYYNPSNPTIAPTPYPINGTPCTPPIQTPSGIPYGINNSSYYFGVKGFATAEYSYNAFQALSDGTHTAGGLLIGQALATTIYPQGTVTAQLGTLTTPTALGGLFYAYPSDQWPSPGTIATVHNPLLDGYSQAYQGMFAYNSTFGTNGCLGVDVANGANWGCIGSWVQYGSTYSASKAVFESTGVASGVGAASYVQYCHNFDTGSPVSISCTFANAVTHGNTLLFFVSDNNNPNESWSGESATPVQFWAGSSSVTNVRATYFASVAGGEVSLTVTGSGSFNYVDIVGIEVAGLANPPVDQVSSVNSASGSSPVSNVITPSMAGEFLIGLNESWNVVDANGITSTSPFTSVFVNSGNDFQSASYYVQPAVASITAGFSGGGGTWAAYVFAFKPSGSGSTGDANGLVQVGTPISDGAATLLMISGVSNFGSSPTSANGSSHIWGIGPGALGAVTGDVFSVYNLAGPTRPFEIQSGAPTGTLTLLNNGSVTIGYNLTDDGTNSALEVKGITQSVGTYAGLTFGIDVNGLIKAYATGIYSCTSANSGTSACPFLLQSGPSSGTFFVDVSGNVAAAGKVATNGYFEMIAGGAATPGSGYGGISFVSGCTYDFWNATASAQQSFNPCGGLVNSITVGGTPYSGALTLTGSTNEIVVAAGGSTIQLSLADGQQICKTCDPQFHDVYASDGYYIGMAGSGPTNIINSSGQFVGTAVNTTGAIQTTASSGNVIQVGTGEGITFDVGANGAVGALAYGANASGTTIAFGAGTNFQVLGNGNLTTVGTITSGDLVTAARFQAGGATGGCAPSSPVGIFTIQGNAFQVDCAGTASMQTLYVNNGSTTTVSANGATGLFVATRIQAGGATGGCSPVSPTSIFTIQGNKFEVDCDGNESLASALYVNDTTGSSPVTVISAVASTKTVTAGAFAFGTQGTWQYGLSAAGAATLNSVTWGGGSYSLDSGGGVNAGSFSVGSSPGVSGTTCTQWTSGICTHL